MSEKHSSEALDPGLKARLIGALKKVKTDDGQNSLHFMVCVAKPHYGLMFGRNSSERLGASHKKELTKLTKGNKFIEGKCVFENNTHTFVVESVPAGLAGNLKKALKEYTGLTCKIRVRDMEGKVVVDSDTEPQHEAGAPVVSEDASAPPSAPSIPGGQEIASFTARLKALQPDILKAIAAKTSHSEEIKQGAMQAAVLANKKDFVRANQLVDALEALLQRETDAIRKTSAQASKPNGEFQTAWSNATSHLRHAVDTVQDQLAVFGAALMASGEENLVWIAEEGLSEVFGSLRDEAIAIDRATSRLPARVVFKARPAIEVLKRQIASPRVLACDKNQLGVPVTIRSTFSKAIEELEAALELARI